MLADSSIKAYRDRILPCSNTAMSVPVTTGGAPPGRRWITKGFAIQPPSDVAFWPILLQKSLA